MAKHELTPDSTVSAPEPKARLWVRVLGGIIVALGFPAIFLEVYGFFVKGHWPGIGQLAGIAATMWLLPLFAIVAATGRTPRKWPGLPAAASQGVPTRSVGAPASAQIEEGRARRCSGCGIESAEPTCFVASRAGGVAATEALCITCEQRRRTPSIGRRIGALLPIALLPAMLLDKIFEERGWPADGLLFGILLYPFLMAAHELGHALTAKLLGLELAGVELGHGRVLWQFKVGAVPIRLLMWPFSGRVYLGATSRCLLRTRLWFTILMGPLTNVLLCAVTVRWWDELERAAGPALPALSLSLNVLIAFANLLPFRYREGTQPVRSDGLALILTPRMPDKELDHLMYSGPLVRSLLYFDAGDVDRARHWGATALARSADVSIVMAQSCYLLYRGEYVEAHALLVATLERASGEEAAKRATLYSNTSLSLLLLSYKDQRDEVGLQRADQLSDKAFSMYPCVLSYRSTRSLVLSAVGRYAEALQLLDYIHYQTASARDRAGQAMARAFAFKGAGDDAKIRESVEATARLDPASRTFLARLELLPAAVAGSVG